MVTISRRRSAGGSFSAGGSKHQMAVVFLFIAAMLLLRFNSLSVPDNDSHNLRQQYPKRKLDDVGNERKEQMITTTSLGVDQVDFEENIIVTPTINEVATTAAVAASTTTTTTTTTTASTAATTATTATTTTSLATTMPIRDMIYKRSLEVKQLILDQFAGRNNSPPNPRYLESLTRQTRTKNVSCDEEDAFSGIPIEEGKHHVWVPPGGHSREVLTKWETAYAGAMKRIREETSGGDKLREFAEMEVKKLRKLHHLLFCKRE